VTCFVLAWFIVDSRINGLLINLSASFITIMATVLIVERYRHKEQEKELIPSRKLALEDVTGEVDRYLYKIYNYIDKDYTHPIAGRISQDASPKERAANDFLYVVIAKVLKELSNTNDTTYLSTITEIDFVKLLEYCNDVVTQVEHVKNRYSFVLNTKLHKQLLELEDRMVIGRYIYDLNIYISPTGNILNEKGRVMLNKLVDDGLKARNFSLSLENEYSSR
jgi:hypothetical protein